MVHAQFRDGMKDISIPFPERFEEQFAGYKFPQASKLDLYQKRLSRYG